MDYGIPIIVQRNIEVKGTRIGDYTYDKESDTIFYSLPYPFPCALAVKSLKEICVTPMMLRLPSFLKYHNIDWLRQQLMQICCVEHDAILIHGAAWSEGNIGYLACGFPNSGKTTIVIRRMINSSKEVLFCSDENVIIQQIDFKFGPCKTMFFMFPIKRKSCLTRKQLKNVDIYLSLAQRFRLKLREMLSKILPLFEPNIYVDLPYERHGFDLAKIIYLSPGADSLALLTDNEFPFFTNPVIQTYAYATGWDLDGVYKKYRELIKRIEDGTGRVRF